MLKIPPDIHPFYPFQNSVLMPLALISQDCYNPAFDLA